MKTVTIAVFALLATAACADNVQCDENYQKCLNGCVNRQTGARCMQICREGQQFCKAGEFSRARTTVDMQYRSGRDPAPLRE